VRHWKAAAYNLRRLCTLIEVGPQPFVAPLQ
jgi:hypothetical protein